ncbi:DMT family transporter [Subtercola sp. YIM 133946]|uniref:DMT family transporter n=1 Tax=Subtercola sp. YIM 133946 TaxID=3118909 RepID=UPI002F959090
MKDESSAIAEPRLPISSPEANIGSAQGERPAGRPQRTASAGRTRRPVSAGLVFGFLGVLSFSFTLPFTRVVVGELDPLFVGAGRAVVAAALSIIVLLVIRPRLPRGRQWLRLLVVAAGVVAGFPLLTSFAMQSAPAAHGAVVIGVLPAATAVVAVLRGGERPSRAFWLASIAGLGAVVVFVAVSGGGLTGLHPSDLLLLAAVVLAAIGYAEGALLARELGSWQIICWALVIGLPVMLPLALVGASHGPLTAGPGAWLALAYVSIVSQFIGFFVWYRGLAIGPIATISQVQLLQPVLTIVWAALLFGEGLDPVVVIAATVVVVCAGSAVRARVSKHAPAIVNPVAGENAPA